MRQTNCLYKQDLRGSTYHLEDEVCNAHYFVSGSPTLVDSRSAPGSRRAEARRNEASLRASTELVEKRHRRIGDALAITRVITSVDVGGNVHALSSRWYCYKSLT